MERLQKILSARGLASRRAAEEWIRAGRVTLNGKTAALGDTADADTDEICVDGKPLPRQERLVYLMLHKPRGYVTTLHDEKGRPDAAQLVADCGVRVYPVGPFANRLMHPSHQVEKTYEVRVSGFAPEKLTLLSRPIVLDGYRIAPPEVRLLRSGGDKAWVQVVIHEGRNRQVRRMCQAAGLTVLRLKRTREGDLCLGDLPLGKWRSLTEAEIANLKK